MQDNYTNERQEWLKELQGRKPQPNEMTQWIIILAFWAAVGAIGYLTIVKG